MIARPLRPAEQDIDLLGRTINAGDVIAYPVTVGRSAAMRIGRVVEKLRPSADYEPLAKVTKPDLTRWVLRVEYTDESMDWGVSKAEPARSVAWHTEALAKGLAHPPINADGSADYSAHFSETHWFRGTFDRVRQQHFWRPYEEVFVEWREYHERALRLAQKKLAAGPKPKIQTLLFPGKAVVITDEYANVQFEKAKAERQREHVEKWGY